MRSLVLLVPRGPALQKALNRPAVELASLSQHQRRNSRANGQPPAWAAIAILL